MNDPHRHDLINASSAHVRDFGNRPSSHRASSSRHRRLRNVVLWVFLLGLSRITCMSDTVLAQSEPESVMPTHDWPALPELDGAIEVPAQPWPLRPGSRTVRALVHYPDGKRSAVNAQTGIMLTLHNWGGSDCIGTAEPRALAREFNVVSICVNYLQSGPRDSIEGPEPYDFGYLQALDALRAMYAVHRGLEAAGQSFDRQRIFATGGSGGGNVALMANKLAPRTFAAIIDLCGMKKLTDDIAFNLPGGSDLNARYVRDPDHPHHLSLDAQELRFVGNPQHLRIMRALGSAARVVVVHGIEDTTCPYADAVEMVENMRRVGLDVEPHWIGREQIDGTVFTSTGHSLGDRTRIVLQLFPRNRVAARDEPDSQSARPAPGLARRGPSDFERRDEVIYPTTHGRFVISYRDGAPWGRFEPQAPTPRYRDHSDLSYVLDAQGQRQSVRGVNDWEKRRSHIRESLQQVMGPFPSPMKRVPLKLTTLETEQVGSVRREKVRFQSESDDAVTAYLFRPVTRPPQRLAAVLCLHQTTEVGKAEPAGISGDPDLHYALELAQRGYVTLAPDYPSFAEHPYDFSKRHDFASGSMKAIWDNQAAVDLLQSLPEVDAERIGCIGHSLGGHHAIFTAVFDERLKVVVSSCGFTSLRKDDLPSWTGPRYMPRIATIFQNDIEQLPFDFHELIASLAPRAFFAVAATRDDDFDLSGVRDTIRAAEPIYQLYGAAEKMQTFYPDAPHSFPPAARERAYTFLDRFLREAAP